MIMPIAARAVVLNLCSEADAFVAASFMSFSAASKLAFLILGPMFDIKLLVMYTLVFRRRLIRRLVTAIVLVVFAVMTVAALVEAYWLGG